MDVEQNFEWLEAQKIEISVDLVDAALKQLKLLAVVDHRPWLYEGPLLERAIQRYKGCWLPLLAKHSQEAIVDAPLVVPLDCEWIWHCHRLNPIQYKNDCMQFCGRILNNDNVESSTQTKSKHQSEKIWASQYPKEPFELEYCNPPEDTNDTNRVQWEISYDLVSAVRRQSSFYCQVATPSMHDRRFLQEALARYKGFLYLIKRNIEKGLEPACVPTNDVDLIWHSHQLYPISYCNDMQNLLGRVIGHDDTDNDQSQGSKLDAGFSNTTEQFENIFGVRYWKAGAMRRSDSPYPLIFNVDPDNVMGAGLSNDNIVVPTANFIELYVETVDIKHLPSNILKESLYILFSKGQPDKFMGNGEKLNIFSNIRKNNVASIKCEPTGELILTVIDNPTLVGVSSSKEVKTIGTISISLDEFIQQDSKLSFEKWFELKHQGGNFASPPVCLRLAISSTVPKRAPCELTMVKTELAVGADCIAASPSAGADCIASFPGAAAKCIGAIRSNAFGGRYKAASTLASGGRCKTAITPFGGSCKAALTPASGGRCKAALTPFGGNCKAALTTFEGNCKAALTPASGGNCKAELTPALGGRCKATVTPIVLLDSDNNEQRCVMTPPTGQGIPSGTMTIGPKCAIAHPTKGAHAPSVVGEMCH